MFIMIDNYDSFTYNLVHLVATQGAAVKVYRNDAVSVEAIARMNPDGLIISPGPGRPENAGVCLEAVRFFAGKTPILGVCLGHQTIAQAFGASVVRAQRLFHGKGSPVTHDGKTIFSGVKDPFYAMRYHSLLVAPATLPDCLEVSATTEAGEVMGLRHKTLPIEGVQFHPESIAAEEGEKIIRNFLFLNKKQ